MRGGEAWCTPGWSGKGGIPWRFFFSPFFFFRFFPWEMGGANQLRFRVVVQLLRGGVVPPSSSPSFSFSNYNTEPERYWCQRFGCCCFFFFSVFFSVRGAGLWQCCGSFGRGGGLFFEEGEEAIPWRFFFLFFFVVSCLLNSHFSGL